MSKQIKIGFVGVGAMGQMAHLRNYTSPSLAAECEVVALAELRPKLAQKVAARYGVPRVYAGHEEMLAGEKLDAIVAAQQFARHGQLLPELARAGVPVFSEKPLASSVAVGERIVSAFAEHKTWLMVGYHKRSDPAAELVKRTVSEWRQSGAMGKLRYVRVTIPPGDWLAAGWADLLRADDPPLKLNDDPPAPDLDADGVKFYLWFVNYYIHQVNLLRFLLGENYTLSYADPAGILLVAHSDSGVTGVIEMQPYTTQIDWHETALVAFERGYLKLKLPAPLAYNRPGAVEIYHGQPADGEPPTLTVPSLPWVHAMKNQALNFIKAVRGEAPAPCLAPEALEDLKVAREYQRLLTGK
ncbi:MAG: Gfo/Idh/MocA family oxidoreductase [Verrucomicrobiales bacterium]|jgi:predicted dehydrogenase|nr:Gfo/Idh/MocA family oxidoreductase [Verrucomicrobiales bacterium]